MAATETLSDFLKLLEREGELAKVAAPVEPKLEIAGICDRMCKTAAPHGHSEPDKSPAASLGGKALLFQDVRGSDMPVAINTFGSYWRINQALGSRSLGELAQRVAALVKPEIPTTLIEKMKKLPDLLKLGSFPPRSVRSGICQQVVLEGEKADLNRLPLIQCWPLDGDVGSGEIIDHADAARIAAAPRGTGRYITFGGIFTQDPDSGDRNIGMYRVQQYSVHAAAPCTGTCTTTGPGISANTPPAARKCRWPSSSAVRAFCPTPPPRRCRRELRSLLFAGFLNGGGIELVPCRTIPLEVPANAEIVIEGWVDPKETLLEGPFGDHTGFYSLADFYPAFDITAITHRKDPIYPTTIVGKPPMEDYFLGKATERIFLPLLQTIIPDIVDYNLPISGVFHNCAFMKIRKEYPMQARRVMHAVWGAGQMAFTKFIIVVDENVDVHNEQDVLFHWFANCDPQRDAEIVHGPVDILDHASPDHGTGSKIGFDATVKWPGEGKVRRWPRELEMDRKTIELVASRWKEYGF